ncbi:MAG: hypothetical protein U0W24_13705 [Bacteroidales bacterium]
MCGRYRDDEPGQYPEVGQNGYEFIFGERLKNLEQGIQNEILNREYYQILTMDDVDSNDKIEIQYYVTGYKNRKLITTYSTKRAAKDKAEREEKVKKAQAFINNPSALAKKARTYFLKKKEKISIRWIWKKSKRVNASMASCALPQTTRNYRYRKSSRHTNNSIKWSIPSGVLKAS